MRWLRNYLPASGLSPSACAAEGCPFVLGLTILAAGLLFVAGFPAFGGAFDVFAFGALGGGVFLGATFVCLVVLESPADGAFDGAAATPKAETTNPQAIIAFSEKINIRFIWM